MCGSILLGFSQTQTYIRFISCDDTKLSPLPDIFFKNPSLKKLKMVMEQYSNSQRYEICASLLNHSVLLIHSELEVVSSDESVILPILLSFYSSTNASSLAVISPRTDL
jgi:hypothetical protein